MGEVKNILEFFQVYSAAFHNLAVENLVYDNLSVDLSPSNISITQYNLVWSSPLICDQSYTAIRVNIFASYMKYY